MAEAHIGSVLPIKNRVLGADEETTFLAHYDLTPHDILRGVQAAGFENSLKMDGLTNYMAFPNEAAYNLDYITVETWVYLDAYAVGTDSHHIIVNKESTYEVGIAKTTGQLQAAISPNWAWRGSLVVPIGKWAYVACSYDGDLLTLCVDDQVEVISMTNKGVMGKSSSGLGIGARGINSSATSVGYSNFGGKMAEVRLWNQGKTASEMQAMKTLPVNIDSSSLIGYWRMNEGVGNILSDYSWVKKDGLLKGSANWSAGNAVFTLRKGEGRFGGAIAVEDASENLIPNGTTNSYPTIGNGWGTYQTNQYNSNTSFSIGTVESVTDNIVTLNPVGRPIYTYDVLNADTSGGGVTAGVEYFIKKHSENSFSLHAYDSSQDGSKGLRVHDSINNDVRVPVSMTDFPTMWHGAPHRPNSGLVKEVIRNGFSSQGKLHDCLRLHTAHKTEGSIQDHLAYGVTPTIVEGNVYTVSFYHRAVTASTIGRVGTISFHTAGISFSGGSFTLTDKWERFETTFTAPNTGGTNFYVRGGSGVVWDISEIQIENKETATSFTEEARETGRVNYALSINPNLFTLNFWAKTPDSFYVEFIGEDDNNRMFFRPTSENQIGAGRVVNGVIGKVDPLIVEPINEWHMYTLVSEGSLMSVYQDGILKGQGTVAELEVPTQFFKLRREDGTAGGRNALFDEVRIDSVARTPEEIMAWYESNSPFWPRGIYRKE